MKLYSSAMFAMSSLTTSLGTQLQAVVKAAVLVVATEEEAEQAAMRICEQLWPASDGYFNHTISILEVSLEAMQLAQEPHSPVWNKYLTPQGDTIQLLHPESFPLQDEDDLLALEEQRSHSYVRNTGQSLRLLKVEQSGA